MTNSVSINRKISIKNGYSLKIFNHENMEMHGDYDYLHVKNIHEKMDIHDRNIMYYMKYSDDNKICIPTKKWRCNVTKNIN